MHWLLITHYPPLTFYYLSSNPWNFSCQDSKCNNSLCHLFLPFPGVCSVLRVSSLWHSCVTSDQAVVGQLCERAVISLVQGPLTSLGKRSCAQTISFTHSPSYCLGVPIPGHVPCGFCNFDLLIWLLTLNSDLPYHYGLVWLLLFCVWFRLLSLDTLSLLRCCGTASFGYEDPASACLVVTLYSQLAFLWGAVCPCCSPTTPCLHFCSVMP